MNNCRHSHIKNRYLGDNVLGAHFLEDQYSLNIKSFFFFTVKKQVYTHCFKLQTSDQSGQGTQSIVEDSKLITIVQI
jgi:hypothetical protein